MFDKNKPTQQGYGEYSHHVLPSRHLQIKMPDNVKPPKPPTSSQHNSDNAAVKRESSSPKTD